MNIVVKAGGVAQVIDALKASDAQLLPKVAKGLARGLDHAAGVAKSKYLSGPRPVRLDVVTRRLRDSVSPRVVLSAESVRGQLGTNVPYAAYHELGFHGMINVSAHTRTVAEFFTGRAVDSRRPIKDRAGNIVGYKETRTQSSSRFGTIGISQQVRAHTRRVSYSGRPFLSTALRDSLPVILRSIQEEVAK